MCIMVRIYETSWFNEKVFNTAESFILLLIYILILK